MQYIVVYSTYDQMMDDNSNLKSAFGFITSIIKIQPM